MTTATTAPDPAGGTDATLAATDAAGVSGIEYRLGAATAWTRYSGTVVVPAASSITFRAVDVNGNVEASQTLPWRSPRKAAFRSPRRRPRAVSPSQRRGHGQRGQSPA